MNAWKHESSFSILLKASVEYASCRNKLPELSVDVAAALSSTVSGSTERVAKLFCLVSDCKYDITLSSDVCSCAGAHTRTKC